MENFVIDSIMNRRSIRRYKDTPIDESALNTVLQCAVNAPSARNLQPWDVAVTSDKAFIDDFAQKTNEVMKNDPNLSARVSDAYHVFHHAPTVLFVSGHTDNDWNNIDCGILAENVCLAAESLGLGTCIVGFIRVLLGSEYAQTYIEKFGVPVGYKPLFAITLGTPDETPDAKPRDAAKIRFI